MVLLQAFAMGVAVGGLVGLAKLAVVRAESAVQQPEAEDGVLSWRAR